MQSLWGRQQPESGFRTGFQSEEDYEVAERHNVRFRCSHGHEFAVTFAADVRPAEWECPRHGVMSGLTDPDTATIAGAKHGARKTHWEQVLKRRSIPELEALLAERLHRTSGCRPQVHSPPILSRAAP